MGMYAATKFAVEAMSESLSYEIGHFGVRVVLVEPGNYQTEIKVERSQGLLDETSAYMDLLRTRKANPDSVLKMKDVSECALAIVNAIEDDSTPLRLPVGIDAEELIGQRIKLDDPAFKDYIWKLFNMSW
jgi:NAD(P)-dependent dehydrogenase (short-subunit alcohol dehydrogenase family)